MRELGPRLGIATSALAAIFIVVMLLIFGARRPDPEAGLSTPITPVTATRGDHPSASPTRATDRPVAVGSPGSRSTDLQPTPPLTGSASSDPADAQATPAPTALEIETLVAQPWRDALGTVRIHFVVAATNRTDESLSLAPAKRTFRVTETDGRLVQSGRFAYAFPFVVGPGETSHLITTIVMPVGTRQTDVRLEADLSGYVLSTVASPRLEVTDLTLESADGRPGVRGIVHNTSDANLRFGVVAVIGRDDLGNLLGGWYDNVNIAAISAGGEASFATEYPGLPPDVAGRIEELSAVAFDAGPIGSEPNL